MTEEQMDALMEALALLLRYVGRHGTPAEQAAALEHWQALREVFQP
jgi:hypothetical protein